ncbi:Ribonuclease III [hydrothermal vent metagenome]|uniref:ribonuclease III n=1 Tax=hydrothermal vent metagenome TaxID=652676 RepID=A0A3B1CAC4_9ZZZZ
MILGNDRLAELKSLSVKLEYPFKNFYLLNKSLTHSSFANETQDKDAKDNERFEFLGDSILDLIVSRYLIFKETNLKEGDLSKIRSQVVNESSLARLAAGFGLGGYLLLGKGEEASGGREKNSILADAFEAMIAAIYLDSSFEEVYHVLIKFLIHSIDQAIEGSIPFDEKGRLQKYLKSVMDASANYRLIDETGPDHSKTFTIQVWINGQPYETGVGKTKKEAEQLAAGLTYEKLNIKEGA